MKALVAWQGIFLVTLRAMVTSQSPVASQAVAIDHAALVSPKRLIDSAAVTAQPVDQALSQHSSDKSFCSILEDPAAV